MTGDLRTRAITAVHALEETAADPTPEEYADAVLSVLDADPDTPTACICDGGAYEVKDHPFLVHPDCPVHRPDTPTADAPADDDLAESIKRDVQDALFALNAERQDQGWHEGMIPGVIEVSRLVSAALLPLVRAQVEAARRDALNEAADEWLGNNGGAATWLRDRAARGETRQP